MKNISIRFNNRFNFTFVLCKNMFIITLPFMFTITVGDCKDIAKYYRLQRIVIQIGKHIYIRRYFKRNVILSQKDTKNIVVVASDPIPDLNVNIMIIKITSLFNSTYYYMDHVNTHLNTASVLMLPKHIIASSRNSELLNYIICNLCGNLVLSTLFMVQMRKNMGEDAIFILSKVLTDIPLLNEEKKYNFKRLKSADVF